MSKKRIAELDILRATAFIFVVLQHTVGGFSYRDNLSINNLLISKFIYTIAKAGVPIFLFLSAVTLIYTYNDKLNIKEFYIKKIKFLFLPFAIWSIYCLRSKGQVFDANTIWTILSGDAQYHLWYMAMIIRIYLYFPIIYVFNKFLIKQKSYIQLIFFICFTLAYIKIEHFDISGIITNIFFDNPTEAQKRFFNCTPINYYIYFTMGQFFVNHYEKFKKLIIENKFKIIGLYSALLLYDYYVSLEGHIEYPFSFIKSYISINILFFCLSIIFIYLVAYYIGDFHKSLLCVFKFIGKYSFPAYLIHVSVLNELVCTIPTTNQVTCMINICTLTVIISIGFCWLMSYLPFSKYVLGVRTYINFEKARNNIINYMKDLEFYYKQVISN
ncbi:MAG: acyltransferase [Romboutsia sp.]|nr:acyltransferase [Romboutsia sp.]